MKSYLAVISGFQKGAIVLILAGFLGESSVAAPIPLPDWIKPIEKKLPHLTPELISEVDDICHFMTQNEENLSLTPRIAAQWELYALRYVKLREKADQAMIWQYLKATGGQYGGRPDRLSRLGVDRGLAVWLLPVVRFRIEWLTQALHLSGNRKYLEEVLMGVELIDIENYLFQQGEFSDIENLNRLVDEAIKLHFKVSLDLGHRDSGDERLKAQVTAMKKARDRSDQQTKPYWQFSAGRLIAEGLLKEDDFKLPPSAQVPSNESDRPKPLEPRKPLPEIDRQPTDLQHWRRWLLIVLAIGGWFFWRLRKLKRVRVGGEDAKW